MRTRSDSIGISQFTANLCHDVCMVLGLLSFVDCYEKTCLPAWTKVQETRRLLYDAAYLAIL
jgi:hypothetical protein